jgi:hypothetical protein
MKGLGVFMNTAKSFGFCSWGKIRTKQKDFGYR